jgi:hypothetical protein
MLEYFVAEAPYNRQYSELHMHDVNVIVTEEYVDQAIRSVKQDIKVWLMGVVMASAASVVIPLGIAIFQLGSINQKLDAAFAVQAQHTSILAELGGRLERLENSDDNLIAWAKTQSYVPPERVR